MSEAEFPKLFVLDTNVLMHDPAALFNFQEHNLYIPMRVLEELDGCKKGVSDAARNARQASRFLEELVGRSDLAGIKAGIPLARLPYASNFSDHCTGRVYFEVSPADSMPTGLDEAISDNRILAAVRKAQSLFSDTQVILVSKDINMRIKGALVGIVTEDYQNDQVLDDINLLYRGYEELPSDFWESLGSDLTSWATAGSTFYQFRDDRVKNWFPNQFLFIVDESSGGMEAVVRSIHGSQAIIEVLRDYRGTHHGSSAQQGIFGIKARNREQNAALNALLDPEIDFVTLMGTAGTGKTLLTLAAALHLTLEKKIYKEIIMTRETISLGEDIGFLPGSEEEKMAPWMGALMDNLELLSGQGKSASSWEKGSTNNFLMNKVKIKSLGFMRGRTFLERFIILDEAQNLTSKQMKSLITRAGPGTKIVCLGNIGQIDAPLLTATTSGLTNAVDKFRAWPHSAHITLARCERSRLADFAGEAL